MSSAEIDLEEQAAAIAEELGAKKAELVEKLKQWVDMRAKTIQEIKMLLSELSKHNKNVKIADVSGASASLAGSVTGITGAVLLFTPLAALGAIALVAGAAVGVAGAATQGGATITGAVIEGKRTKKANALVEKDKEAFEELIKSVEATEAVQLKLEEIMSDMSVSGSKVSLKKIGETLSKIIKGGETVKKFAKMAHTFRKLGKAGIAFKGIATATGKAVGKAALGTTAKAAAKTAALNVVGAAFSTYEIIDIGKSLHNCTPSEAMENLSALVKNLREELEEIKELMDELETDMK